MGMASGMILEGYYITVCTVTVTSHGRSGHGGLIPGDQLHDSAKLDTAMHLLQLGWKPNPTLTNADCLRHDGPKEFWTSNKLSSSKNYFIALARSSNIFHLFGDDFQIYHRQLDNYYGNLLRTQSRERALELRFLLESKPLADFKDAELKCMTDIDQMPALLDGIIPIEYPDDDLDLEIDRSSVVRDEASRRSAIEVLLGVRAPNAPDPIKFGVVPFDIMFRPDYVFDANDEIPIKIYFDHKSHGSREHRRVWANCANHMHENCFRYCQLKDFKDLTDCSLYEGLALNPSIPSVCNVVHFNLGLRTEADIKY